MAQGASRVAREAQQEQGPFPEGSVMSINKIKTTYTRRQTERALLGATLVTSEILDSPELALLQPEHFSVPGHREIWRAVRALRATGHDVTPQYVQAEMERAGAADLADLFGISTANDLHSALIAIQKDADHEGAIEHAIAVRQIGENLTLVDQLEELSDAAKAWPPTARSFFCQAFDALATMFCTRLVGAR
jgi:DnaB-like helicase N terminal domain